ncbi:MAG: PilZ domain-containing protein [Rhodospirillaceae bacterium]|jgi:hypothetical protein|nr:PilZ domain-containing protein [Rhodospirillaceae bacterium]MBT6136437.1 PilZ domain-containing protein [Rhodospirillaceae bacterium]
MSLPQSRDTELSDDRRQAQRLQAPMTVVIGNTPYAITNWSLSGVKIADYYGDLAPPDDADLRVLVPTAGPGALFQTEAEVRRREEDTPELAVAFKDLDPLARQTLNRYFHDRIIDECE